MSVQAGTRLGPYEIVAPLGEGGMGEVFEARDTRLNRRVAVKLLRSEFAAASDRRARFEQEARAIASLAHPHICTLYDVGREQDIEFLVMELLDGQTLDVRLGRGPLPLQEAIRTAIEVADALDCAHRHGVVHGDLKPGNIMLTKSGAKLLDFGLATLWDTGRPVDEVTRTAPVATQREILGTLPYMAPEQLEGKRVRVGHVEDHARAAPRAPARNRRRGN